MPPKKKTGMQLGMMGGSNQKAAQRPATSRTNNKDNGDPRSRVRRAMVKLSSIVEFADMQTRRSFDPNKHPRDKRFAESIKQNGLVSAVAVQPIGNTRSGRYRLIHGHRRYAASDYVGFDAIPADIWDIEVPEQKIDEATMVENTQRDDLSPIELARMIVKYKDKHGVTQREAGAAAGQSKAHTSKLIALLKLPDDVQDFIDEYQLKVNTAYKLVNLNEEERKAAMEAIIKELPVEIVVSNPKLKKRQTNRSNKKTSTNGKDKSALFEDGYKTIAPWALAPTKKEIQDTKLKDLGDREVILLSQVMNENELDWAIMLPEIKRLPKPAIREAGKALDQVMKVYSYSGFLNKVQMRVLLKGIHSSVEKLLEEVESK